MTVIIDSSCSTLFAHLKGMNLHVLPISYPIIFSEFRQVTFIYLYFLLWVIFTPDNAFFHVVFFLA